MGNLRLRSCVRLSGSFDHRDSVVPETDPRTRSVVGNRIVRADIDRDFDFTGRVLGTGYSGAVRCAVHRTSGLQVAVKSFSKRRLKPHRLELLRGEVQVYLHIDHPNICRLLHAYEGKRDVWLIMELCGCELYSRLCERRAYHEADTSNVAHQMLQAVSYLHAHQMVHRDLKLENWMYGATARDDRVKLIDFGFSRILTDADETLEMPCGTLHYTSPEVLSRKYTSKCDIWSLGVICYMLLLGRPPFRGSNNPRIARSIMHDDFGKDGRWAQLSCEAKDFVTQLLHKDAKLRLDATQALAHPWIMNKSDQFGSQEVGIDVLKSLQKFARGSHLRRAALTVMAYSLTSKELQDLEQVFLAFDKSGQGTITFNTLAEVMQDRLEVTSQEVERIFQSMDFANDEEVHYTPFIAAMLATRVQLNEDKVRTSFEAFDQDGTGFITAESIMRMFNTLPGSEVSGSLSREDAERWIREVDFKGNGVIDYDEFFAALSGKSNHRHRHLLEADDTFPTVRVFDSEGGGPGRPRSTTDLAITRLSAIQYGLTLALVDASVAQPADDLDAVTREISQSFPSHMGDSYMPEVKCRRVSSMIDERYFEQTSKRGSDLKREGLRTRFISQ